MTNLVQLRLPEDRAQQLRNLATAKGTSLSGAVGALMKLLYEHTEAEHNIPSVEVNVLADGIAIRFPNSPTTGFSFDAASKIANTIREYLNGEHLGEKNAHLTDPDSHASSFAVWRRGNSIKVAVPMNAPEKNFTHDLAEEFADLLDKAVTRSKVAH